MNMKMVKCRLILEKLISRNARNFRKALPFILYTWLANCFVQRNL